MDEVFIIDGVRTAIGKFGGSLASMPAADLGAAIVRAILKRTGIEADDVDEVVLGCVFQAGLGQNVARQVAMKSGLPIGKTQMTINMVCGSGLRAVACAAQSIKAGDASIVLAGGAESMSRAPYLLKDARSGYRMGDGALVDSMICDGLWDVYNGYHMGVTAENVAKKYGISRADQDAFRLLAEQGREGHRGGALQGRDRPNPRAAEERRAPRLRSR